MLFFSLGDKKFFFYLYISNKHIRKQGFLYGNFSANIDLILNYCNEHRTCMENSFATQT